MRPALHAADVGISVDTAVDVAKEAADFVLLEQDLAVLHQGIELGAQDLCQHAQVRLHGTTSANFGNMFSMAGASLFLPFLPMLPKQILLINFLTDLPEMTIASDSVDPSDGAAATPLGHRLHPALHAGLRLAQLGLRLLTFGVLLLGAARRPGSCSTPAGSSSR